MSNQPQRATLNARIARRLGLGVSPTADPGIGFAYSIAFEGHDGQYRKYTGEPYIEHPLAVARLLHGHFVSAQAVQVALLHDVIEDCGYTEESLAERMHDPITASMVAQISDVSKKSDGNRAVRKAIDREHIAKASPLVKMVKLCDLIDNTKSIVEHDSGFAKTYLAEKRLLLDEALNPMRDDIIEYPFYGFAEAYRVLFAKAVLQAEAA